jgi:hypothetical protein
LKLELGFSFLQKSRKRRKAGRNHSFWCESPDLRENPENQKIVRKLLKRGRAAKIAKTEIIFVNAPQLKRGRGLSAKRQTRFSTFLHETQAYLW